MRTAIKAAADKFLASTYGFNEETRMRLIENASVEIIRNCRQLLSTTAATETLAARKCAHRLKSNLNSLGLLDLAEEAKKIETGDSRSGQEVRCTVINLCCKITDKIHVEAR